MELQKKKIVILGAGFGGLKAALEISKKLHQLCLKKLYEIILIDRYPYQTYYPTLYEAATTSKETANYCDLRQIITFPINEIIASDQIKFINAEVKELDLIDGDIHLSADEKIKFDYLVIALGAETNYFNISGLKENAFPFKTFLDAITLRDKIIGAYYERNGQIKIVIGGAGPTGVELAGEIQNWLHELKKDMHISNQSTVTLISSQSVVLPGFLPKISALAETRLRNLKIEILDSEKIVGVENGKALLESKKEISYDILVWTGGVKASSIMGRLPLKNEFGKVVVMGEMECLPQTDDLKLYGKIYGIGDAICVYDEATNKPAPMTARGAINQAKIAAANIISDIKYEQKIEPSAKHVKFTMRKYPYVIPIGGKYAIAQIGSFVFAGLPAWIFKGLIELFYMGSIMSPAKTIKIWLKGLKIFIQNDRLG